MQWTSIAAWSLVPGDIVSWDGVRKIASTHWSPTVAQPVIGEVTLIDTTGKELVVPGNFPMRHIGD